MPIKCIHFDIVGLEKVDKQHQIKGKVSVQYLTVSEKTEYVSTRAIGFVNRHYNTSLINIYILND